MPILPPLFVERMRDVALADLKQCRECNAYRRPSGFYRNRRVCKFCDRAHAREWAAANPERTREYKRRHHDRNRDAILAKQRERARLYRATAEGRAAIGAWNAKNADKRAGYQLVSRERRRWINVQAKYRITRDDYISFCEVQGWACAICRDPFPKDVDAHRPVGQGRAAAAIHIDHCHDTGVVRGILCQRCNQAIGLLRNDPESARQAARYLGGGD